jgi:uncharacterized peroxidase-related enzyme
MSFYKVHTLETAPEGSKPALERLNESVGVIPNLAATMAESPTLIDSFVTLRTIYQNGTFTPVEREVISISNAIVNDCRYCVAAHSSFAVNYGIPANELDSLRNGKTPADNKYKALSDFARKVTTSRGSVSESDINEFVEAGYTRAQALEVIVGVAFSVLANYSSHFTDAPLDEFFQAQSWNGLAKGQ